MALKHGGRTTSSHESRSTRMLLQASPPHCTSHSASYRILREDQQDSSSSLQEQLTEKEQYISRLQATLRCEREKNGKLQSRCNQQGAELRRRDQQLNRMREKLSQFTDRNRGASIEIINTLPKPSGRREPASKTARADVRKEEMLQLMLERREAELRAAMKLRHSLTTLLHALRTDMHQTLQNSVDTEEDEKIANEEDPNTDRLVQSEQCLGDHVTGGVVLEWKHVQNTLKELQKQSPIAMRTDQEKLLAQLEEELEQSRELVRAQQQLLQDNIAPLPDFLTDSCYLEEWERLQDKWVEFNQQRQSFQQERQAFTDAAIRLGRERCEFEQQKAALRKQQFLSDSPITKTSYCNRRESTALSDLRMAAPDRLSFSPCGPDTPSSAGSEVAPWSVHNISMTPSTPELYSALQLPYHCRAVVDSPQSQSWNRQMQRHAFNSDKQHMDDWPF